MADRRPILAVDIDGVISLFGFDGPLDQVGGRFHLIDGIAHCISDVAGAQLARLAEVYELVWASGWEDRANDQLPLLLGLPTELPCLHFDGRARFGTAHWKLEALDEYAGDRPLAWLDDSLDESCHAWAARRSAPTCLCPPTPTSGSPRRRPRSSWPGRPVDTLPAERGAWKAFSRSSF